jgi:hypothetical protein
MGHPKKAKRKTILAEQVAEQLWLCFLQFLNLPIENLGAFQGV